MYKTSLGSVTAEIEDLLVEKFSAKGQNLKQKIKSTGRRLPGKIRAHAQYLIEAETRYQNPKRAHQYDPTRLLEARKQCVSYLEKVDRSAQRSFRRTAFLCGAVVNLFLIAGLVAIAVTYLEFN